MRWNRKQDNTHKGPFKCYITQWGRVSFPEKKRYEGVRFNVISVTRGWVGVQFPEKKHYVTLEWPLTAVARSGCKQISSFD